MSSLSNFFSFFRTISPLKQQKLQNEVVNNVSTPGGAEAERALSVVMQKLAKTLSVEALTSQLIQEATSEQNLSQIFFGKSYFSDSFHSPLLIVLTPRLVSLLLVIKIFRYCQYIQDID